MLRHLLFFCLFALAPCVSWSASGVTPTFPQDKIWRSTTVITNQSFALGGSSGSKVIGYIYVESTGGTKSFLGIYESTTTFGTAGVYRNFVTTIPTNVDSSRWYGMKSSTHGFTINAVGDTPAMLRILWDYYDMLSIPK